MPALKNKDYNAYASADFELIKGALRDKTMIIRSMMSAKDNSWVAVKMDKVLLAK